MNERSLKNVILRYGLISLFTALLIVVVGYFLNSYLNRKQSLGFEANKLVSSAQRQADQILPGLLVAEEYGAVDLLLNQISTQESLFSASIVRTPDSSVNSLLRCPKHADRTHVCLSNWTGEVVTATEIGMPGESLGYLIKHKNILNIQDDRNVLMSLGIVFGGIIAVFLGLLISILFFVEKHIRKPLLNLNQSLSPVLDGNHGEKFPDFELSEMKLVASQVKDLVAKYEEKKVAAATGDLAAQVAHDVRSPLALLAVLANHGTGMSDENQKLLKLATSRIATISNNLLDKYKRGNASLSQKPVLLIEQINKIVSEKMAIHSNKMPIINISIPRDMVGTFINVDAIEFGRMLSNLLENSIEACESTVPNIVISLEQKSDQDYCLLKISDNGKGIPSATIQKLGAPGATFDKRGGNGLGVAHARTLVDSVGGSLIIESQLGAGTTILIELPIVAAPNWFVSNIIVSENQKIVAIDDDKAIHECWKKQLGGKLSLSFAELNSELMNEVVENNTFFLVDYNLARGQQSGLDFIETNNLASRSVLVTSDFESEEIQSRCGNLGVRILPKSLIPYSDVIVRETKIADVDLALIDDDELIRMAWFFRARDLGKKIAVFQNVEEFISSNVPKKVPVYIDYQLSPDLNGISVASSLHKSGFTNLNITTGMDLKDSLPQYIKSVQGKDFPAA